VSEKKQTLKKLKEALKNAFRDISDITCSSRYK
jgi:hypothetical protein